MSASNGNAKDGNIVIKFIIDDKPEPVVCPEFNPLRVTKTVYRGFEYMYVLADVFNNSGSAVEHWWWQSADGSTEYPSYRGSLFDGFDDFIGDNSGGATVVSVDQRSGNLSLTVGVNAVCTRINQYDTECGTVCLNPVNSATDYQSCQDTAVCISFNVIDAPTSSPSMSAVPSNVPTGTPSITPTAEPSSYPTSSPSNLPTEPAPIVAFPDDFAGGTVISRNAIAVESDQVVRMPLALDPLGGSSSDWSYRFLNKDMTSSFVPGFEIDKLTGVTAK